MSKKSSAITAGPLSIAFPEPLNTRPVYEKRTVIKKSHMRVLERCNTVGLIPKYKVKDRTTETNPSYDNTRQHPFILVWYWANQIVHYESRYTT